MGFFDSIAQIAAPIVGGVVGGAPGAAIGSAIGGMVTAKNGAKTGAAAYDQANALNREIYDRAREDFSTEQNMGTSASRQLSYLLGLPEPTPGSYDLVNKTIGEAGSLVKPYSSEEFKNDPTYKNLLSESEAAIQRSAAAKTGARSGAVLKALQQNAQDIAGNSYDTFRKRYNEDQDTLFNRMGWVANVGTNADSTLSNIGNNYAANTGNNLINKASTKIAGDVSGYNQLSTGLGRAFDIMRDDAALANTQTPVTGLPWRQSGGLY